MTGNWGLLESHRIRAGHKKDQGMITGLELSAPAPDLQGGERG